MPRVVRVRIPARSLLSSYAQPGMYADCYATRLPGMATHAQFVEAFYTSPLFKLERLLLGLLASRPSTDAEARLLAIGERPRFAAWQVESRAHDEVLLSAGRTRSWLMVEAEPADRPEATRLMFGSAVLPRRGDRRLGFGFHALLGFHKLYSRALLRSARRRLASRTGAG